VRAATDHVPSTPDSTNVTRDTQKQKKNPFTSQSVSRLKKKKKKKKKKQVLLLA
jgi:hypothetical protein